MVNILKGQMILDNSRVTHITASKLEIA